MCKQPRPQPGRDVRPDQTPDWVVLAVVRDLSSIDNCYGIPSSPLRGMSQVPDALSGWVQSIPQRVVPAPFGRRIRRRMDALLFLRDAALSQSMAVERVENVHGLWSGAPSRLRRTRGNRASRKFRRWNVAVTKQLTLRLQNVKLREYQFLTMRGRHFRQPWVVRICSQMPPGRRQSSAPHH